MAELKFTPAQRAAIRSSGGAALISAAAGSGKTRVLTERLMDQVTRGGRDIDTFLIITYTRAAAAELRGRILAELMRRCAAEPENRRLRRQANLCYRAPIGTIHSFCTDILRENAHCIGIAPDFRVAEEERTRVMKQHCLENVLEKEYEDMDPDFQLLADTVGAGRDDSRLERIILSLHEKMQSHPRPEKWAQEQAALLGRRDFADAGQTPWGAYLLERARRTLRYWADELDALTERMSAQEKIMKAYGGSVDETAEAIRSALRCADEGWDAVCRCFPIPFPRLGALRATPDEELSGSVKARREACKKAMTALAAAFSERSAVLLDDMYAMAPAMVRLLELTLRFDQAYAAEKRRQSCLDFSDLEHLALRLLLTEGGAPTALARRISARYTEIMVDEYQDVNAVQDMIFGAVSRGGRNLFMVGDVKQSIYRFRLADPGIFMDKYRRFAPAEKAEEGQPRKILLRENFRSRACVLNAANHVFGSIMSRELGELDYDEEAMLRCGADYYPPAGEAPAELIVAGLPEGGEEDAPDKVMVEARLAARKIRGLVASGLRITAPEGERPVRYGDIVVLLRSPGSSGAAYAAALAEAGVPVSDRRGGGFFAAPEVSAMISLLAVIDNPHQDVPLISALRSMFGGFSADELAVIRSAGRAGDFYDALCLRAQEDEKCAAFVARLNELRALAGDLPTDVLLRRVYNLTDAAALTAASGAEEGPGNLMLLLDYARKFEEQGFRGLFRFVASMRRMMERGEEPPAPAAGGDAVTIMSIHKSKGLEFPVVFLCDTGRRFNRQDTQQPVLVHSELGLGPKYVDTERGVEFPTLARRAVAARITEETLSEEMRVLYVAMTRAKERLFITCAMRDPERGVEKLREGLCFPIPPQLLETAQSPAQWLIRAALLEQPHLKLTVEPYMQEECAPPAEERTEDSFDEAEVERLARDLAFRYENEAAVALPSKITATELKGAAEPDADAAELLPRRRSGIFRLPELGQERALTGAERGTAAHLVMQYIDFARTGSRAEIEAEIERLCRGGYLSRRQADAVEPEIIERFFRSAWGRRVLTAGQVLRELPFSLLCPAQDYFPGAGQDELLLQGVIDCCILEDDEFTIIDYKTDYVNKDTVLERASFYAGQLRTYVSAVSRMTGRRVGGCVLYFLRAGLAVRMDSGGVFRLD